MGNYRFKFRIWDVKNKKYRTSQNSWIVDMLIDPENGLVTYGEGSEIYGFEKENAVILEQCTGMKDKNDKLVYEGDIVSYKGNECIVKWVDYGWFLYSDIIKIAFEPFVEKEIEVIGNIHLLDEKNN